MWLRSVRDLQVRRSAAYGFEGLPRREVISTVEVCGPRFMHSAIIRSLPDCIAPTTREHPRASPLTYAPPSNPHSWIFTVDTRAMGQIWSECLPPPPTWTTADIPDLTGKIALVTGGNSGIGKETVRALLEHNATVYLAARDESKAKRAIDELKEATGKEARFLKLDLADLKAVKAAAEEYSRRESRLDILFNSA